MSTDGLGQTPAPMPPADLGGAFSPPPRRSDGLAGTLQRPRRSPEAPPPAAESEPAAADTAQDAGTDAPVDPPESRPAPRTSRPSGERSSSKRGKPSDVQVITVYLPVPLRDRLRTQAGDRTHTEVVLQAIDHTHTELVDVFQGQPATTGSSLFSAGARARRRRHEEPVVQVSLRPLREHLQVIDDLVESLGAPSRNALVIAALERDLPAT